ncbi:hypothetical protein MJO29_011697 [Puccinia striiformis f. sp. tritici]|nr:hypothetical protein MJO29_011697 [Puccinia striiformis f. sp. tritici]
MAPSSPATISTPAPLYYIMIALFSRLLDVDAINVFTLVSPCYSGSIDIAQMNLNNLFIDLDAVNFAL